MFEPAEDLDAIPPPAYELTQEDYDRKTSQVVSSSASDPIGPIEEEWEDWDEAAFEAAFEAARNNANASASSSSSTPIQPTFHPEKVSIVQEEPAVRPLRIVKKPQSGPSTHVYSKATEAYGNHEPLAPPPASGSLHLPEPSVSRSMSMMTTGRRTPPPAFEPMGPSLDGPEYQEVVEQPPMPAPRASRSIVESQIHAPRTNSLSPASAQRQPLANAPPRVPQRPMNQYPPPQRRHVALPHNFDPMAAYHRPLSRTPTQAQPGKVDASAFYNSAVSSHLGRKLPQRAAPQPFQNSQLYQQSPSMPQHQAYNSPYNNAGFHLPPRPPSISSSDSSHSHSTQPFYTVSNPSLDTHWNNVTPPLGGYQSFNPNR